MDTRIMKRITTIVALIAIATAVHAQKAPQAIGQAFDEFYGKLYKDGHITSSSQKTYKNGYYKSFYFALPQRRGKLITEYGNTLSDNGQRAYSSLVKKAGTTDDSQLTIGYGEGNRLRIIFGTKRNHNYNVQVFRDKKDSTMRYVYALVWYAKDDSILGCAGKYYGKDPNMEKTGTRFIFSANGNGISAPGISISKDGIYFDTSSEDGLSERLNVLKVLDGKLQGVEEMSKLDKALEILDKLEGKPEQEDAFNSTRLDADLKVESGEDVIQKFNNLQIVYFRLNDKYKDYRKLTDDKRLEMLNVRRLMIATNTKIKQLIADGNTSGFLAKSDKEFLADQLSEMSAESKDKWLKKSLKEQASALLQE